MDDTRSPRRTAGAGWNHLLVAVAAIVLRVLVVLLASTLIAVVAALSLLVLLREPHSWSAPAHLDYSK